MMVAMFGDFDSAFPQESDKGILLSPMGRPVTTDEMIVSGRDGYQAGCAKSRGHCLAQSGQPNRDTPRSGGVHDWTIQIRIAWFTQVTRKAGGLRS